jgi:peptidoglycan hydrolase CwlO-like protein
MPEYVVDFSEFSKVLDELLNKTYSKDKPVQATESDVVSKYKKLYEASIKIENLKERRSRLEQRIATCNDSIAIVDMQIEELNKLFTTN